MKKIFQHPLFVFLAIILLGLLIRHFLVQPYMAKPQVVPDNVSSDMLFASQFPDADGTHQKLSQYKGKILIVNFWATWCPPCREEMPELSAMHEKLKDKNVMILGIATDELDEIQTFAKESPVSYPLFAASDAGMELSASLGNHQGVLPFTAIIRPDGSIAHVYFGRVNEAVLNEGLTPILTAYSSN